MGHRRFCSLGILLFFLTGITSVSTEATSASTAAISLPIPLEYYTVQESAADGLGATLGHRVQRCPFNLVATLLFLAAVLHTLFASRLRQWGEELRRRGTQMHSPKKLRLARILHGLGETELVFGLWVVPLGLAIGLFFGKSTLWDYLVHRVDYTEALFLVVIMSIAGSEPVLRFVERGLRRCARLGNESPAAWCFTLLSVAPLLGSLITEPAAMTLSALLLARRFYPWQPSPRLAYATLGLLFVHISVGGTLTPIAAPPILMVVKRWDWSWAYVFRQLGLRALLGIALSTLSYGFFFRKELRALAHKLPPEQGHFAPEATEAISFPITAVHLAFLLGTILSLHRPLLCLGGFLLFLLFNRLGPNGPKPVALRQPLLVGCFLAGLVIHGGLQSWWIAPLLGRLGETALFTGSVLLTAFNDNAALTYLASLVPEFLHNPALQHAVVAGAVTGGGLTLIANAPNPAGAALLSKFFPHGLSPLKLFLAALTPTLILATCFGWR
ncbi:MAG: putative Na+/H+ antiporter [Puniceicoccales bacterium]|nr:putative Na+/H+ antiporter [Puniceicoccales bacterium]